MIKLSEQNTVIILHPHAAETSAETDTAVAAPAGTIRALGIIDISANGGDADETYTFSYEGRVVAGAGSWVSAHAEGEPATLVATQPTASPQIASIGLDVFAEYRTVMATAGTTPSVTYGSHILCEVARLAAAAQALA